MTSRGRACFVAGLLVTVTVGAPSTSDAQSRSTLTGTVKGSDGAVVAGATVTLEGSSLQGGAQVSLTNARGVYRFSLLAPGVYDLTATLQGRQIAGRPGVRLSVGTTLTVDLAPGNASAPEAARSEGSGPVVDVTTATSATNLTNEDLDNLPTGGLLQLVPGVTPRAVFGNGSDTSPLTVDGGPITVTLRGGSPSATVNLRWMEEAQIIGPGAGAEYGEFSGALVNIAVRSGGNRWSGQLDYSTTPPAWVGDNTDSLPESLRTEFRPEEIESSWGSNMQIGGPLIRDRLSFFTGLRFGRSTVFPAGRLGRVPQEAGAWASLTKVLWAPARHLRLEGHVSAQWTRVTGILGRNALPETAGDSDVGLWSWNQRATWTPGPRTLVEMRYGGLSYQSASLSDANRAGPPTRVDRITGIRSGNASGFDDGFASRQVIGASLTRFLDLAARSHALEVGVEVERSTYRQVSGVPGGRSFTDARGVPEQVLLWDGDTVEGAGTRITVYAQDKWTAASRLTIQPGLRVSVNRGSVADRGVVFRTHPVSPRLGVAWDVATDHKTVVRAAYGRLHEGLHTTTFDLMNTSDVTPKITMRVLANGVLQEINRTPVGNVGIDDNLAHAHTDEYVVGLERELFPDASLTVHYVRRNVDRIWARINTTSQYAPVQRRDPGQDGQLGTSDDGELITVFNLLNPGAAFQVLSNPDGAFRRYEAVQVIGQKRYARNWQLLAAYTWSSTRGTVGTSNGDNRASGPDTGSGGVFVSPNRLINAEGPTASDFAHQLNIQGTYFLPALGVAVSGGYRALSGSPWGRVAVITGLQQGNTTVRIEPRGTRRTEPGASIDARVEKTFTLGRSGRTVGVYTDVLNLTNQGVPLALSVVDASGATFGEPTAWAQSRRASIAVRVKF